LGLLDSAGGDQVVIGADIADPALCSHIHLFHDTSPRQLQALDYIASELVTIVHNPNHHQLYISSDAPP